MSTHLGAGGMLQVLVALPIHLEPEVVVRVHHLVRQRILEVLPVPYLVGAEQNAVLRAEPTRLPMYAAILGKACRTAAADDI